MKHIYHKGSHKYPNLHRKVDIQRSTSLLEVSEDGEKIAARPESFEVSSRSTNIQRMADRSRGELDRLFDFASIHGEAASLPASAWGVDEVAGPNITDKKTVLSFARMAANAYITEPFTGDWEDVRCRNKSDFV